jgi:hypothetical protein
MYPFDSYLASLRTIFLCHSRRKGIQSEFFSRNIIAQNDNGFEGTVTKLKEKILSIKKSAQYADSALQLQADLRLADSLVRSLSLILSDRTYALSGLKKDDEKLAAAIAALRDIKAFTTQLQNLMDALSSPEWTKKHKFSLQIRIISSIVHQILQKSHQLKLSSLERFVESSIGFAIRKELFQRFQQCPGEFAVQRSNSYSFCKNNFDTSLATESEIVEILSRAGFDRFHDAMIKVIGHSPDDHSLYRKQYGQIINVLIRALLTSILEARLRIDEGGLYKLYRLILGVEEYLSKARSYLQYRSNEPFLEDRLPWVQAQALLDLFHCLIFEKPGISNDSHSTNASNLYQKDDWARLVANEYKSCFCTNWIASRKKRKGAVFIALKLNESLL